MTPFRWTRAALPTTDTEEIPVTIDLPAPLAELDIVLPVGPLARLVTAGAPRWAYTVLASDMAGPWRRVPRVGAEALEHGIPARPAGPRKVKTGSKLVNTPGGPVDQPVYRDGEWLDAAPAVPPLRGVLERAGTSESLEVLVEHLDGLAGIEIVPVEPDAPEGWTVPSWAPMRSVLSGQTPPPLRWSAPAGGGRRPELAALRPVGRPERLVGIPRCAPPVQRDGGLVASDGRLVAVRELVRQAAAVGAVVDREDVVRVIGWVCGAERGLAPVAGRGTFAIEWSVPGVTEADRQLGATEPTALADQVLAAHGQLPEVF